MSFRFEDEFNEDVDRRSGSVDENGECGTSSACAAVSDVSEEQRVSDGAVDREPSGSGDRKRSLSGSKKRPGSQGKHYVWTLNNPSGDECDQLRSLCSVDSRISWLAFSTETGILVCGDARRAVY